MIDKYEVINLQKHVLEIRVEDAKSGINIMIDTYTREDWDERRKLEKKDKSEENEEKKKVIDNRRVNTFWLCHKF